MASSSSSGVSSSTPTSASSSTTSKPTQLESVRLVQAACNDILKDPSFHLSTPGNKDCLRLANTLLEICSKEPQLKFFGKLCEQIWNIFGRSTNASENLDRDKMWTNFHQLRQSRDHVSQWEQFLSSQHLQAEPLFYQHISLKVFTTIVREKYPTGQDGHQHEESSVPGLTYEEENAIRFIGGYILKGVRKELILPKDNDILLALGDLCECDDDKEPAESEEWLAAIDRGGLTRITDDCYHVLCAVEYAIRRHFRVSAVHKMDDTFRKSVTEKTVDDCEVQFYWCMASAEMTQEVSDKLLDKIVTKFITVRGFSFASSVMEQYKRQNNKGLQKSKPLRSNVGNTQ